MLNNLKYFNKQLINIRFFIILFLFWLSINTGSKYLDIQFLKENLSSNKLNFIRALFPYFILIYLVIYNFYYKKKLFALDFVFKLFAIYGLIQILGLVYYKQNLYEHYWVICLFSLIFYYHFIDQEKNKTHFLDYWRVIRSRKELILSVAFLVILTGTIYTLLLPNTYSSSSRISILTLTKLLAFIYFYLGRRNLDYQI